VCAKIDILKEKVEERIKLDIEIIEIGNGVNKRW